MQQINYILNAFGGESSDLCIIFCSYAGINGNKSVLALEKRLCFQIQKLLSKNNISLLLIKSSKQAKSGFSQATLFKKLDKYVRLNNKTNISIIGISAGGELALQYAKSASHVFCILTLALIGYIAEAQTILPATVHSLTCLYGALDYIAYVDEEGNQAETMFPHDYGSLSCQNLVLTSGNKSILKVVKRAGHLLENTFGNPSRDGIRAISKASFKEKKKNVFHSL